MANILVVDDELGIRDLLWEILNDEGHQVEVQPVEDHAFENQEPYVEEAVEFEPINTD